MISLGMVKYVYYAGVINLHNNTNESLKHCCEIINIVRKTI